MRSLVLLREWPSFDATMGGIEGKVLLIAKELSKRGIFEPVLITDRLDSTFARAFSELGFRVYDLPLAGGRCVSWSREMNRILQEHDVAALQSHTFRASIVARRIRRTHPALRHIFRVHTHIQGTGIPWWRKLVYHVVDGVSQRWVDLFVPISDCVAGELHDKSRVDASKIRVVHNGIPAPGCLDQEQTETEQSLNTEVGLIGRIQERKQQHLAVRALALLRDEGVKLTLHLIGDDTSDYGQFVHTEVARFDLCNQVVFHGYQPRPFDLLLRSPIIVLPSSFEGVPTSLVEGMAMRKIVVGTPTGGTAELVRQGKNGFLHNPGDAHALAAILSYLFSQPAISWESLRNEGYNTWQNEFSTDVMIDGLLAVYRDLGIA